MILFILILFIQYLIRHKDYPWAGPVAHFIKKRLDFLRFLLQVTFVNPYANLETKTNDCRQMKSVEKSSESIIEINICWFLDSFLLNMEKYR